MRIVFVGCVEFSRSALEKVLQLGGNVVGICTLKDSVFNADHSDLSDIAVRNAIPCLDVSDLNAAESLAWIRRQQPDVVFCFGWSRLLKREFLSIPKLGVVGFHPAALPQNRGRHPVIWALVLGLKETGSTFFFMDEGADSGDILSQSIVKISNDDDAGALYQKITSTALEQIERFLPRLSDGTFERRPQDLSLANSWRKRQRADGLIDWRMSAQNIHNLVRGLAKPYVGASFIHEGVEFKVWKTERVTNVPTNIEPGRVIQGGACPVVKCGEGAVGLILTEPAFSCTPGVCL